MNNNHDEIRKKKESRISSTYLREMRACGQSIKNLEVLSPRDDSCNSNERPDISRDSTTNEIHHPSASESNSTYL